MDDLYDADDYLHRHTEGFPCKEAERLEDAIARMLTAREEERAAWLEIGSVALALRNKARMSHNAKLAQLAKAREQKRPPADTSERLAG